MFDNEDVPLKPLTEYEDYVDEIRRFTKILADRIKTGDDPNEVMGDYNQNMNDLENRFVSIRIEDYESVRANTTSRVIQAEANSVDPGKPRPPATTDSEEFSAPDDMVCIDVIPNKIVEQGDTDGGEKIEINNDGTRVKIWVRARSQRKPQGKSHIMIAPVIIWGYELDVSNYFSHEDFKTLKTLADDRLFRQFWR
ncbi:MULTISPECIES: hypothetical protein [Lysinibacillus]|uniref:hypothetical protein n=1 Tax=Lysinibacillus TaxID=400634 RepID=UPI00257B9B9C|nr:MULTISPECIES: hypothetical protein [Lysinibacillus]